MTKQVVQLKHNTSMPGSVAEEAYVINPTDVNDLDELFRTVLLGAHDIYESNLDANLANDDGSLFINMWSHVLARMNIVITEDWRHSKGANHTAVKSPAKDADGSYLPLDLEEKWGCFNDALIAHNHLSSDYKHSIHDWDDPVIDKAIGTYWRWLEDPNQLLNFDGLAEIDQILI